LVRLPKVRASQNLAGPSFLSRLLIFYPPRFSPQEERESLSSTSDFGEVAIPFSNFFAPGTLTDPDDS
jgi:hypothetical protein